MTTMIGDNVHAQKMSDAEKTAYLALVRTNQPTLTVVMDSFEFAQQVQDAAPNCVTVHRDYMGVGGDDDLCQKLTPVDWLTLQRNKGDFRLYRYTCNESGWNDTVIQWHITLLKLNAANPIPLKLCILNLGVGQPRPEEWANGKELLQLASQYKEWCLVALHEYASGIITSGFIGGAPDDSRHVNYIPVENWPTPAQAKDMTMWHMGRFKFLNLYCKAQNIPLPRIAITEWGFDHLGDIEEWLKTLQMTAPYTSIRGWKSLKEQWAKWFASRGWSHERAYIEQLHYAFRAIYENTNVVGMAVFCAYLANDQWQEFDISKAEEFQKWRTAYATALPTPAPIPAPVPVPEPPEPPAEKMITLPASIINKLRIDTQACVDVTDRMGQMGKQTGEQMVLLGQRAIAASRDLSDDLSVLNSFIRDSMST